MRHSMVLSLAAVALAVGSLGGKCAAQNVPSGTYQQSCKDIRVNGDTLQARCEDNSRHWRTTELSDFYQCSGDITNVNGTLTCDRSQSNYGQTGVPAGSYQQSCRDIRRRGNRLEARCEDGNRNWNSTSLDNVDRCTSDITNVNGTLQCERRASNWQAGGPSGTYQQSCRDIRRNGDRLEARCETNGGDWVKTSLDDVDSCTSDIVNENGQLRCERRGRQGRNYNWQGNAPQGSYTQSCRNIRMDGDTLRAECPNPGGHFKASSLSQVSSCVGDITNRNGKLWCSRQ